ncbi:MAG: DUF3857 domain-containing protein [Nonlabens sp.]
MKNLSIFCLFLLSGIYSSYAQLPDDKSALLIPQKLQENANAVIRANHIKVVVNDYDDVDIIIERMVTVYNKRGMGDVAAVQGYDENRIIKKLRAVVYDKFGKLLAKVKKKDFKDESAVSGGTLYSNNRVKYLNYVPNSYPVTITYESEVRLKSTAFLPRWLPIEYFYASTEASSFKVINNSGVEIKVKESNLEDFNVTKNDELNYEVSNLAALVPESYSPDFTTYAPEVKIALKKFKMEGVDGVNKEWTDFGKWMYDDLLQDTVEIPEEVIEEVRNLTSNATTEREKAKIIYNFMQQRSRYISVQVGIGGWKPILASEVHKMGYGDCKGLSNYTRTLMTKMDIDAEYAVIYGGRNIQDIDKDFSSTQGNHAVLFLPNLDDKEDVWLECTSRTNPFGYIANFTDDRDALVVTPEGGRIVHTTVYPTEVNTQNTEANITIRKDGSATGNLKMEVKGLQYAYRDFLANLTAKERAKSYQQYWEQLNGLSIVESSFVEDKDKVVITENVQLTIDKLGSKTGNLLLFSPVVFNKNSAIPDEYENRNNKFEIDRGYVDTDSYTIKLEEGIAIDALPKPVEITKPYGEYKLQVTQKDDHSIEVFRYLKIETGSWSKDQYEDYRQFRAALVKYDNKRGVLKI